MQNPCCSVCALIELRKQRSQKCGRTMSFLSFHFSRCNADERYLSDGADGGKASAQQRHCHHGCWYHPRAAVMTQAGLEKQLRLHHPFSPGQRVSKSCVLPGPEMGPLATLSVSLFHLPHLLFLPYLDIETKPSPQLVPFLLPRGFCLTWWL